MRVMGRGGEEGEEEGGRAYCLGAVDPGHPHRRPREVRIPVEEGADLVVGWGEVAAVRAPARVELQHHDGAVRDGADALLEVVGGEVHGVGTEPGSTVIAGFLAYPALPGKALWRCGVEQPCGHAEHRQENAGHASAQPHAAGDGHRSGAFSLVSAGSKDGRGWAGRAVGRGPLDSCLEQHESRRNALE